MRLHFVLALLAFSPALAWAGSGQQLPGSSPDLSLVADGKWKVNDMNRPMPEKVAPESAEKLADSAKAPADAVILFDGKDLSAWNPSKWKVENGYMEVVPKTAYLISKQGFGSCHLHLEWWTQDPPVGTLQMKGNSGVYLMSRYEIQVLDTYDNPTYADGIAGAVYGQTPPLVNPIRPSGQWQYYDIDFHRPLFDAAGKLTKPGTVSVIFNGVKVQDNTVIQGNTGPGHRAGYETHPDTQPLSLQEHGCVVRFRNIWLTPLAD
jgi:hypothetical protein